MRHLFYTLMVFTGLSGAMAMIEIEEDNYRNDFSNDQYTDFIITPINQENKDLKKESHDHNSNNECSNDYCIAIKSTKEEKLILNESSNCQDTNSSSGEDFHKLPQNRPHPLCQDISTQNQTKTIDESCSGDLVDELELIESPSYY